MAESLTKSIDDDNIKLPEYHIQRQVLLQGHAHRLSGYEPPSSPIVQRIKNSWNNFSFLKLTISILPILDWLPKYQCKNYFFGDLSAGLTVAVMHIPQGMAYAILAEVPPKVGLYMAFLPLLTYVVFGTSRHNSMGTFAVISIMCAKVVVSNSPAKTLALSSNSSVLNETLNSNETVYTPIQIVTAVSFCTSMIYFVLFLLQGGAITALLSDPLISGFIMGASIHVFVSQLKNILGIAVPTFQTYFVIPLNIYFLFGHISEVNYTSLTVSALTIVYMICMIEFVKPWFDKKSKFSFPIELVAVIVGVVSSMLMDFEKTKALQLVGEIPVGLPKPIVPPFALIGKVALSSISIAIVSYSIVMSMGILFARKDNYTISSNQELLALGMCNLVGSMFSCIPISASLSRSALQYGTGGKTQIASVIAATVILFVLLWIGPIFEVLPRAVLSGIIVIALRGVFKRVVDLKKFYKQGIMEVLVWIGAFLTVVIVAIDIGLLVGFILSTGMLYINGLKTYSYLLGQIGDTGVYVDLRNHKNAEEVPKIKIFRYCGSINSLTKGTFQRRLYETLHITNSLLTKATANKSDAVQELNGLYSVIIDLSCCKYLDHAGCQTLAEIGNDLNKIGAILLLACPLDNVYRTLEHNVAIGIGPFQTCPTVHDAVLYTLGLHNETADNKPKDEGHDKSIFPICNII